MDDSLRSRLELRLREDDLGNIMALKFLSLLGGVSEGRLVEEGSAWASWFHYPPERFAFDRRLYHDKTRVAYWNANDRQLARESMGSLPAGSVVKVSTEPCLSLARDCWELVNAFVWFSTDSPVDAPAPAEAFDHVVDDLLELSERNGYDRAALKEQEGRGCRWYLARWEGVPSALCYVQPNHGRVWEVSGVLVDPGARGRGLAKRVVAAAVNDIVARGLVPRYFVHDENAASLGVARSLGLKETGHTSHFFVPF